MKKIFTKAFIIGALALGLSFGVTNAATVLFPYQGGTGTGTAPTSGQVLIGTSTSKYSPATIGAGTGISLTPGSGSLTITNSAPDQTVAFTNGTGISVTGTYPNFTVTNSAPFVDAPSDGTTYGRKNAGWEAVVAGVGDMVLADIQSVTGLKTFDKDKIAMKGTSTGVTTLSTANTGATNYTATLQAADGTIAYTSDIPVVTGFATKALDNLASVAINTTLVSDTDNTDALGTAAVSWSDLFLGNGSVITWSTAPSTADITLVHASNRLTLNGGGLTLGTDTISIDDAELDIFGDTNAILHLHNTGAQGATAGAASIVYALPTGEAMASGNRLGAFVFGGSKTVANVLANSSAITSFTTENWSNTATGSNLVFEVTPNTTTTREVALTIGQDKSATFTGIVSGAFNGTLGATTPTTGVFTTATVNTGLMPDANDGAYLGQSGTAFSDLFLASGGIINWNGGASTLTHSANTLTIGGSGATTLALGTNSLTMTGSIGATGARVTKGWFTDLESTNGFTVNGSATSGTILKGNGTKYVASTETYAAPGTSGNIMTSDGTNWTSAAPVSSGISGLYTQKVFGAMNSPASATAYKGLQYSSAYNSGSVFYGVMSTVAGELPSVVVRYALDTNTKLPLITHQVNTSVNTEPGLQSFIAVLGDYVYVSMIYTTGPAWRLYRYDAANLANETNMTISGTGITASDGQPIFSDGTYLYVWDDNGNHFHKYSVSGTTATYDSATFAFGGANLSEARALAHWSDGTNVYCDRVTGALDEVGVVKYLLADGSTISTTTSTKGLWNVGWRNTAIPELAYNSAEPFQFSGFIYVDASVFGLMRSGMYKTPSINNYHYYTYLNPITKP